MDSRLLISIVVFSLSFASHARQPDKDCIDWFKAGKIKVESKNCEIECATLMTDMGTFICTDQCGLLCKLKEETNLLGKFIYYPGLTDAEKKLVASNPNDAIIVYKQMRLAEESSSRNFPNQDMNDESDAFRHFVWSSLLTKELGTVKAKEFLDAHEANPLQPESDLKMDRFNNERGQSAANALIKEKNWNIKNIEAKGLEELRSHELQVLKPGLSIPMEPR